MAAGRCERHARATVHSQAARSIQSIRSIARWRNTRASSIPTSRGLDRSTQRTIQTTGALHRLTARAAVSSCSKFAVEGSIPAITAHARPVAAPHAASTDESHKCRCASVQVDDSIAVAARIMRADYSLAALPCEPCPYELSRLTTISRSAAQACAFLRCA